MELLQGMWTSMAFDNLYWGNFVMWVIALTFVYLAINKGFEPLLLLPIAFGILLVNLPSEIMTPGEGLLWRFYHYGEEWAIIPPLIFLGIGAMTDFGPVIANPKTLLLGAGAQGGVYVTFFGALALGFNIDQAAVIGIIGGADGPTTIFLASKLAPEMMGICAVAAYSYMALVPVIQPPVMKLLTTEAQRKIRMKSLRKVSKLEKIFFPIITVIVITLVVPDAAALMGMFCFGNLMRESGVVDRLSLTAQNELMNIVTIFLGISVGATMPAEVFLTTKVIGVFILGSVAFCCATACGIGLAHLMNLFLKEKINPLIGAAGVSAVPMAARVAHKMGSEADKKNYLLMHAMGPNVAGVIGTAVAAGMFLSVLK
ncbi:sodium ion-translocating decarboxylase subunit beta [Desulfosporosinus nitroreducens]|uniref:Sodium ion-translocating decarboxylase subunit beta n=1 Tax=Desulfosporosinus nitroreducens TaxID=2018668 RepID=A0ABT8QNZ7_9FIRM|nr:sodium ion-translocating decarboxylase subunit beta [Desulfosporosinus nitroreducens]MCO1599886.1 sodium ion-translocating decarboxylase subunit beta [Desulfosporosinus nitroreducens]MDO0823071.1 sodium ion-translocating decarboxylase subunit beta [Desulfosporosinus nitroreducens]